ncbi:hypothetical protein PENTCL1PPCAC_21372 [Pristionchus entomophagus]|uniref:Ribosomal protein n=1 Tax=Pristionchus entomophagus TaxID=358040 RepID=A0AAV5TYM3_9BILA|nr:hypothetical protein PENTCL1PPCAC_21372 [Pristionchus entomophagus]
MCTQPLPVGTLERPRAAIVLDRYPLLPFLHPIGYIHSAIGIGAQKVQFVGAQRLRRVSNQHDLVAMIFNVPMLTGSTVRCHIHGPGLLSGRTLPRSKILSVEGSERARSSGRADHGITK